MEQKWPPRYTSFDWWSPGEGQTILEIMIFLVRSKHSYLIWWITLFNQSISEQDSSKLISMRIEIYGLICQADEIMALNQGNPPKN